MAKILVVDDSESLRLQLKTILTEKAHTVIEGFDGEHGLEVLKANTDTQLIICDVNMPNMDGLTMCMQVSGDSSLNKIPIFMLTTDSNTDMKAKGKSAGVRAWITKPYDEVKLLAAVSRIVGS